MITWIIKGMNVTDQKLGICVEQVETDIDPSGMRNNFDKATTFMVAADPVQKQMKKGDKSSWKPKLFLKKLKATVKGLGDVGKNR